MLLDIRNLQVILAANGDEVETVFGRHAFIRVTRAVHEMVSNHTNIWYAGHPRRGGC
jgi:hypothetical protein